jgi:hypothetical protein
MAVTNGYATLSDVKAAARITDTVDDSLIELSIEAASREIDGYCQRYFYNAGTATRFFAPEDAFITLTDDVISVSEVVTADDADVFATVWTSDDYQLEPVNGLVSGLAHPFTQLRAVGDFLFPSWVSITGRTATVKVTGVWGWAAVPTAVRQSCILLAMRQFKRYDSPLGVAGFGDLGAIRVGRVDPDVEALLMPFKKVSIA